MPRYRTDEHLPYFCTITVLDWLPVFIESRYIDPIIESLTFCRRNKGLQVGAFVVMPNHLHLVAGADANLEEIVRDFKRFTSRAVHGQLAKDGRSSILRWLEQATEPARRAKGEFAFWEPGFQPKAVFSPDVLQQKLRYLHENPVRKGLVTRPEDWWYSSARNYAGVGEVCMEIDPIVV